MSYDLAVWYPSSRLDDGEAGALYARLCAGDAAGLVPHPSVDAFYTELTAKHPNVDDIAEGDWAALEASPWSCGFDPAPTHLIINAAWSKAEYVTNFVLDLAKKHGLAVYSPQVASVAYPDEDGSQTHA